MKSIKKLIVEEKDIDELDHVNNRVYLFYLEEGRKDWYLRVAGKSIHKMIEENYGVVVLKINILFKKEAVLKDSLHIVTIPKKLGNKSFVFEQKIENEKGDIMCEATVTLVMMDLRTRKSVPVIDGIARNFK